MNGISLLVVGLLAGAGEEVVARVDGATITGGALVRRMEAVRSRGTRATPEQVLEGLVNEALLAKEARRLKLEPGTGDRLETERRKVVAEIFIEKDVAGRADIGDSRLRELFHATADFAWFESLTFESVAQAEASLARIRGGATFAAEAPKAVVSRAYPNAATTPPMMRAQIAPALAKALFAAEPGAIVGPVTLEVGVTVARLVQKEVGTDATFAARRDALLKTARKQLAGQMRAHIAAQLRAKAGVKLDDAFLHGLQGVEASPQQLDHVLATVNGRPVRYRDIHGAVRGVSTGSGHMAGPGVKIQLAWQEIDTWLLADAARERGFDKDPDVLARMPEVERLVLGGAAHEALQRQAPAPSEKEIEAFYKRNAAHYRRPFEHVLPQAAADAAAEKRNAHVAALLHELRKRAAISVDPGALARAVRPQA